jgi:hypothetical protein
MSLVTKVIARVAAKQNPPRVSVPRFGSGNLGDPGGVADHGSLSVDGLSLYIFLGRFQCMFLDGEAATS